MLSTIPSLAPGGHLSPTGRARVRQLLARRLGEGLAATRATVLAELHTSRPAAGGITPVDISVTLVTSPDRPDATPDPTPDAPVTFAAAADRLGVSVATAKRYAAPSSGKLARLGDGISRVSLEAMAATR
ncbi:conserved hypothetical protein [Frankia sp. Hr75.2]|nr:conserved hypothetical protein [Frankia sp. Hr75.2]